MKKTSEKSFVNRFHIAGIAYLIAGMAAGMALAGHSSVTLQTRGFFALHAYLAFMGFGTLMVLGTQIALVPGAAGVSGAPAARFFIPVNVSLWGIWAGFIAADKLPGNAGYIIVIVSAAAATLCIAAIGAKLFPSNILRRLFTDLPLRFFATSLFMYLMAYPQLIHLSVNLAWPGTLPFSGSLALRHSYLALSFPISLTIMGTMSLPFESAFRAARIRGRALWEAQYFVLVAGVFALFFSLLFDTPAHHGLFAALQTAFSAVLLFSIMLLAAALAKDKKSVEMPPVAWRYYTGALIYLSLTGLAGFGLSYKLEPQSSLHYFLLQTHIHLALIGWVGLGLTGVFHHLAAMQGEKTGRAEAFRFAASHTGTLLMCVGIYLQSHAMRAAAGALLCAAFISLLAASAKLSRTPIE